MKRSVVRSFLSLLLASGGAATLIPAVVNAADTANTDQATAPAQGTPVTNRVASIRAMMAALERESGKAGIDRSALLDEVAQRTRKAETLAANGELATARSMLDEDYRRLTAAVAQTVQANAPAAPRTTPSDATTPNSESKASREAVERELTSTTALLAALKNQAPSPTATTAASIDEIENTLSSARKTLDHGDTASAAKMVHEAYLKTTTSIRALQ